MIQDTNRATGKTTGLMLQAIGKAIENPGMEVEFIDHHKQNFAQLQYCKERIEKIAKQLNLDVSVRIVCEYDWKLLVKSNWGSLYAQKAPVEEAFKKVYCRYPDRFDYESTRWDTFKQGFEAARND